MREQQGDHRTSKRWFFVLLPSLCVVALAGGLSVATSSGGDNGRATAVRASQPDADAVPSNEVSAEIYGSGKVAVMGPNGVAGWVYVDDLQHHTTAEDFRDIDALNETLRNWAAPVHDANGDVIGYWVTNGLGFVDLVTYNSPDFDADALRAQRRAASS